MCVYKIPRLPHSRDRDIEQWLVCGLWGVTHMTPSRMYAEAIDGTPGNTSSGTGRLSWTAPPFLSSPLPSCLGHTSTFRTDWKEKAKRLTQTLWSPWTNPNLSSPPDFLFSREKKGRPPYFYLPVLSPMVRPHLLTDKNVSSDKSIFRNLERKDWCVETSNKQKTRICWSYSHIIIIF